MMIVLREMTRDAADAILAGERPGGVRVADDYPTEFSAGVAQCVGAVGQFGPYFLQRLKMTSWSARSVARSSTRRGHRDRLRRGRVAVEPRLRDRGRRGTRDEGARGLRVRRIVAHTPLERPESGRVLEKAGFAMVRAIDEDQDRNVVRVKEWELAV